MLEFSAFRDLLPGFLPDNMKSQMRAFILFHKNAKAGLANQVSWKEKGRRVFSFFFFSFFDYEYLSDAQTLITQKEQLLSELQPQLAKRRKITREILLFKDAHTNGNLPHNNVTVYPPSLLPLPLPSFYPHPLPLLTLQYQKPSKSKEEMKKITQNLRSGLALLQPYTQNMTKDEAQFLLNEIKDVGVSFFSLQEILKHANG